MSQNRNNNIAIAKAIGIILMVTGHSGCPAIMCNFLYTFHMPLFLFFSGYFFNEIKDIKTYKAFCAKKIKGLYLPYLRWSLGFLVFHNIFYQLNIYNTQTNSNSYQISDFTKQAIKSIFMIDYELLIRPFWFIKALLLASIGVATISLIFHFLIPLARHITIITVILCTTIVAKSLPNIPIIGDCSIIFFSMLYFYTGYLYHCYERFFHSSYLLLVISFLITLIGSMLISTPIDMRYTSAASLIPYYSLSLIGIIMVICFSQKLDKTALRTCLYYIGNHTMSILALNLLALKAGNLIKIWFYDMPIDKLSSHTVIGEHNTFFWPLYSFIGIILPLLANYLYYKNVNFLKKIFDIRKLFVNLHIFL